MVFGDAFVGEGRSQRVDHKPRRIRVAFITRQEPFGRVVVSVIANPASPQHDIGLEFSQLENGVAKLRPHLRPEPHIQAEHVDGSVACQEFGQLGSMPCEHPAYFGRSRIRNDHLAVAEALFRGRIVQGQHVRRRSTLWHRYANGLAAWATSNDVVLPSVPEHCETPYHLFHMVMPSSQSRDALITHLRAVGILAVFHYQPLHLSPYGQRLQPDADCPVTELVSDRLIRLPFYTNMEAADIEKVINAVCDFTACQ